MGRIIGDTIPLQELQIFLFKISLRMVRRLVRNVVQHAFRVRCADAERSVTFLPGEIGARGVGIVEPLGGT